MLIFHDVLGVSFVLNYMFRLQRRSEHNALIRRDSCVCLCGIQTVRNLCVGRRSVLPFFRKHKWSMIANIVCHDLSCGGRRMSKSLGYGYVVSILKRRLWDAWTPEKNPPIHVVFLNRIETMTAAFWKSRQALKPPLPWAPVTPPKLIIDVQS